MGGDGRGWAGMGGGDGRGWGAGMGGGWAGMGGDGGGMEGSTPGSNPLPFYIPFLTQKGNPSIDKWYLSYT